MNEVNATATGHLAPVSSVTASSAPANREATKDGKELPPAITETSKTVSQETQKEADFQNSVQEAVAHMNEFIQSTQRDLQFSYDSDTGDTIVRVVDSATQEVIRQIPDEIFVKLARQLNADEPVQLLSAQA
ncbi:flagellar protein FlaG [Gilvimarinus agarilyticus]|uniref:flagellar protein FlaG n=1 Tax=Gilvimarinus agarilyticus TaxID=679259 RepID=UPI00059FC229|nr:flagellar protein FlaG [Gilvimarinus agarilyticus]